jgi:hypothetical protein
VSVVLVPDTPLVVATAETDVTWTVGKVNVDANVVANVVDAVVAGTLGGDVATVLAADVARVGPLVNPDEDAVDPVCAAVDVMETSRDESVMAGKLSSVSTRHALKQKRAFQSVVSMNGLAVTLGTKTGDPGRCGGRRTKDMIVAFATGLSLTKKAVTFRKSTLPANQLTTKRIRFDVVSLNVT